MFGERPQEVDGVSLPVKVRGMAERFIARSVRRKTLAVQDTPPIVTFTFDDVPVSACETGAAILANHDIRGTFYVAGGGCGAASPVGRLASIDHLKAIAAHGHEIGCHTYSHPEVSRIGIAALDDEINRNRSFVHNIDRVIALRNFAYPYGEMSARAKRHLESRFDSCRSVHPGINSGSIDLGSLKACPLEGAAVDHDGIGTLIAETVRAGGWLILYSHDVAEKPSKYGVTPKLLDKALIAAKTAGCTIATIAGALDLIRATADRRLPATRS
ncbi:MAG: polysaccharide deacetylase family protein [Hyphomicrobiales bacterium]|nr:polysaccharide deacetylase family protein [Hyphomicrobiales bacterium]